MDTYEQSPFGDWLDEMRRWMVTVEAVANGDETRIEQLQYQTDAVFDRSADLFGLMRGDL